MSKDSLTVKGLSRQFGSVLALDNFNINVAKGELVALLGPSGCGKTTALRALGALGADALAPLVASLGAAQPEDAWRAAHADEKLSFDQGGQPPFN